MPVVIDPVAMITGVMGPLDGDARATEARPIETATTAAPTSATAQRILVFFMVLHPFFRLQLVLSRSDR
jgi:hypothetical protein